MNEQKYEEIILAVLSYGWQVQQARKEAVEAFRKAAGTRIWFNRRQSTVNTNWTFREAPGPHYQTRAGD